jgi:serpin B
MVYAGARGTTEIQMREVLRYILDQERLHPAFNALDLELMSRNLPESPHGQDPVELFLANAFWGQIDYPFLPSFLDLLAVNYGSGIEALDFRADPEGSRETINTWVENKTRDRIQDLLPEGSISPVTVAVLVNALYFKAPWARTFMEEATEEGDFFLLDGGTSSVPMMRQIEAFAFFVGENYQALELPFRNGEDQTEGLSMVFILPALSQFTAFESRLNADLLADILNGLERAWVDITLPKFSFEYSQALREIFVSLGMIEPFTGDADFSGIVARGGIFIDNAYHKTFIAVDEMGAEAAAATAVVVNETSVPPLDHIFKADRPFLFLIRDQITGTILFFGRVVNPE